MKKKFTNALFVMFSMITLAQVGIKTSDPKSTLDVNGNTMIRQVPKTTTLSGYEIMALNQSNSEVSQIDPGLILTRIKTNPTVFSAKKASGISLLSLALFSTWKQINFVGADTTVGSPTLLSNPDNSYVVPTTGIYAVGFYFRYGSGIQASLLTGGPGIGILKNTNGNFSALETRNFNGINLGLIALTISEANINSVFNLNAGDKLYFGLTNSGVLGANLLSTSAASFYVYKISN